MSIVFGAEHGRRWPNVRRRCPVPTYRGSGEYVQHSGKVRPVIRYDYFETPVDVDRGSYIAKFDVEVLPGTNNYRTHQIVNMDLIQPEASLVGPAPTASSGRSSP